MSRRLPNTNDLVSQIKEEASRLTAQKTASATEVLTHKTEVAAALYKLASALKGATPGAVSYEDLQQFVKQMQGVA
jgi:hypothetical protein